MSTISAGTTTTTALVQTGDTTGSLVLQTGSTPTTAMTINSSQIVNFANAPTVGGNPLPSGAMTLISTQTGITGVTTSIQWTGLSNYDKYCLIIENWQPDIADNILVQVGTGSTTWATGGYAQACVQINSSSYITVVGFGSSSSTGFGRAFNSGTVSGQEGISGTLQIANFLNNTAGDTSFFGSWAEQNSSGVYYFGSQSGFLTANTTTKTGIRIVAQSGSTFFGKFSLYGISS